MPKKAVDYRYAKDATEARTPPIPVTTHIALVMSYGMSMTRAEAAKSMAINKKLNSKAAWTAYYRERNAATRLLRELYQWELDHTISK